MPVGKKSLSTRVWAAFALAGVASGAPYALISDPVTAWLTRMNVSLADIGFTSLILLGYPLKVLWAPLVDRSAPPFLKPLGRRLGWMVAMIPLFAMAVLLMVSLGHESTTAAVRSVWILGSLAVFASATIDIAADAYRTDLAPASQRAMAAAVFVAAYRLAWVLLPGAAFLLAPNVGWPWAIASIVLIAVLVAGGLPFCPQTPDPKEVPSLGQSIVEPWKALRAMHGSKWIILLFLVLVFRLPDQMASRMAIPFLIDRIGFDEQQVAWFRQVLGLIMTLFGAFIGGLVAPRLGLARSMIVFGTLQAVSNLGYAALIPVGPSVAALAAVMSIENFCGGLVSSGFVAFLMSCCERAHSATQYALLSALVAVGQSAGPAMSGVLIEKVGFGAFFGVTLGVGLVGILLVIPLWKHISRLEAVSPQLLEPA